MTETSPEEDDRRIVAEGKMHVLEELKDKYKNKPIALSHTKTLIQAIDILMKKEQDTLESL